MRLPWAVQCIAHAARDLARLIGPHHGLVVDPQQLGGLHPALLPNQLPQHGAQGLVNRSHAIVIGTVSAISDTVGELPYFATEDDFPMERQRST